MFWDWVENNGYLSYLDGCYLLGMLIGKVVLLYVVLGDYQVIYWSVEIIVCSIGVVIYEFIVCLGEYLDSNFYVGILCIEQYFYYGNVIMVWDFGDFDFVSGKGIFFLLFNNIGLSVGDDLYELLCNMVSVW